MASWVPSLRAMLDIGNAFGQTYKSMRQRLSQYFSRITRSKVAMTLLFMAVGFAVYTPSFNNRFLLDDESQILHNNLIHSPSNIATFFLGSTMHQEGRALGGIYYKPVMSLSYSLLWWLSPNDPMPFHLYQLLLAISNALLLWWLLRRHMSDAASIAVSLMYLVHPINSEVVLYIADLQDVLYTFFGLIALNFLADSAGFGIPRFLGFAVLLLGSLLSKESGLLYFVACVVYAWTFKRGIWRRVAAAGSLALAIYLYLRIGVAHLTALTYHQNQIGRAALDVRLMTAPKVLASYLWKFIFPRDITATQDWVITEINGADFWLPLAFALAVLGLSVWYSLRCWRTTGGGLKFAFFTFCAFMGMGFHSHIVVPLDGTVADRWFYFSSIGIFAMIGLLMDRYLWPRFAAAATILSGIIILSLAVRSAVRSYDWYDNFAICSHDLRIFDASYDMHNNLGVEYYRQGNMPEAKKEFERSVQLAPGWDINWNNLGAVYSREGNLQKAEESYLRSMENGTYYMAYENYAGVLISQKRYGEAKAFVEQRALPMFPASPTLKEFSRILNSK